MMIVCPLYEWENWKIPFLTFNNKAQTAEDIYPLRIEVTDILAVFIRECLLGGGRLNKENWNKLNPNYILDFDAQFCKYILIC